MPSVQPQTAELTADPVAQVRCSNCECCLDVSQCASFESVDCLDCGNTIVVPARVGAYYVYGIVGRGGMGCVYEAWDPALERMVAIKVMLCAPGGMTAVQIADFERESCSAAHLSHPHIAQVYDFGYHREQPFLVMELVRGRHFDDMIRDLGALDPGFVLRTGLNVADGLSHADAAGLLHGDIKPENILFDEQMHAKLVDFGLATFIGDTGGDRILGTPYYIPPERLQSQRLDARADIYSLGATLYHALSGRTPFTGSSPQAIAMARLSQPPCPLLSLRPDLPPKVDLMVMRMLEVEPARRYPNYRSLMSDLRELTAQLEANSESRTAAMHTADRAPSAPLPKKAPRVAEAPPDARPPRRWGRRATIAIGALLFLGLLLCAFFLAFHLARQRMVG